MDKQAYAAGREAAHAENDWNDRLASLIVAAELERTGGGLSQAFRDGYSAGQKEG